MRLSQAHAFRTTDFALLLVILSVTLTAAQQPPGTPQGGSLEKGPAKAAGTTAQAPDSLVQLNTALELLAA